MLERNGFVFRDEKGGRVDFHVAQSVFHKEEYGSPDH